MKKLNRWADKNAEIVILGAMTVGVWSAVWLLLFKATI